MPPEKMKLIYVPFIVYKTQVVLSNNKDKAYLKIQLHCPSDCTVLCLTRFNLASFKRRLTSLYTKASQAGQRGNATTHIRAEIEMVKFLREQIFELRGAATAPRPGAVSSSVAVTCSALAQAQICDKEVQSIEVSSGIHTIALPLLAGGERRLAGVEDQLRISLKDLEVGVFVLPHEKEHSITNHGLQIKTALLAPKEPPPSPTPPAPPAPPAAAEAEPRPSS
eukprot:gene45091-55160_t